jgi:hypothetical protein
MVETQASPTKAMFESLARLYKQDQLLRMDADRLMGERGWEPTQTAATKGLSNSLNMPERWHARWAARFYVPTVTEEDEPAINRILFVSIHFASDHDTEVDDPIVTAGRLLYDEPMRPETASKSYAYWMCKYWFKYPPLEKTEGWNGWRGQGGFSTNMSVRT